MHQDPSVVLGAGLQTLVFVKGESGAILLKATDSLTFQVSLEAAFNTCICSEGSGMWQTRWTVLSAGSRWVHWMGNGINDRRSASSTLKGQGFCVRPPPPCNCSCLLSSWSHLAFGTNRGTYGDNQRPGRSLWFLYHHRVWHESRLDGHPIPLIISWLHLSEGRITKANQLHNQISFTDIKKWLWGGWIKNISVILPQKEAAICSIEPNKCSCLQDCEILLFLVSNS